MIIRSTFIITVLAPLLLFVSCNLKTKKVGDDIIAEEFDGQRKGTFSVQRRLGDTKAYINYFSDLPMKCEIQYWNQDNSKEPTKARPATSECRGNSDFRKLLRHTIDISDPKSLYTFKAKLWTETAPDSPKEVLFSEKTSALVSEFEKSIVIKADLTSRSGAVLGLVSGIDKLVNTTVEGCQSTPFAKIPFKSAPMNVDKIDFSGFIGTDGEFGPTIYNEYYFDIESIDASQDLQIRTTSPGQADKLTRFDPPSSIKSLSLNHGKNLSIPEYRQGQLPLSLDFIPQENIELQWQTSGSRVSSVLNVAIEKDGTKSGVYCQYDGNSMQGTISAAELSGLSKGSYSISVELSSWQPHNLSNSGLLVSDWRLVSLKNL